MTNEEARALRPGDKVKVQTAFNCFEEMYVVKVSHPENYPTVIVAHYPTGGPNQFGYAPADIIRKVNDHDT